jgi:hypothetical protein
VETPTDRGSAAVDLLSALYPAPLQVRVAPAERTGARSTWTAIPSAHNPRILVPLAGRAAATRMLRRQLTGQRLRTRVARAGLSVAMGSGALGRLPQLRLTVTGPDDAPSIEEPLREVLGVHQLHLTMPVGPARANRKPVLQVADEHGRVLAFAKVGHNELTRRLVRGEGDALRGLESEPLRGVRAPRALACLSWAGQEVLVLEPLDIPARRLSGDAAWRRLVTVVDEIAGIGGRATVDWQEHPYRETLLERVGRCGELADRLRRQVEQIGSHVSVPTGSWHGDLNAGNVALVAGPCPVWDWERFETDVPVGFDLLHHELHRAITEAGVAPAEAATGLLADAPGTLSPLGVGPVAADAAARTYLVTLACRYLADDQRAAGADLGRVDEWLLPALEEVPA